MLLIIKEIDNIKYLNQNNIFINNKKKSHIYIKNKQNKKKL
jgi:hypothetical protein